MANPSALETLVELAKREVDSAAERLAAALAAAREAEQKLDMLLHYRSDYAKRCQGVLASGMSVAAYGNYLVFMQKLDHAIAGQREIVRDCKKRIDESHADWLACEQKKISFGTIASRARDERLRKEARRDQKLNDEHAARLALAKRKTTGI